MLGETPRRLADEDIAGGERQQLDRGLSGLSGLGWLVPSCPSSSRESALHASLPRTSKP